MRLHIQSGWILVFILPVLKTQIEEEGHGAEIRFRIRAWPQFQNMAAITYGPALAALSAFIMALLAGLLDIRDQVLAARLATACGFVLLPLLAWIGGTLAILRLSRPALNRYANDHAKELWLSLEREQQLLTINQGRQIPFDEIQSLAMVGKSGQEEDLDFAETMPARLIARTSIGPITLLPENMGSLPQKRELLTRLREILNGVQGTSPPGGDRMR